MSQSSSSEQRIEVRRLDELVPYWRNPRKISDDAVNAVAESISRYGYQQPIVVDGSNVIIIGHTRYMALRRLGYTECAVKVETGLTPHQVKQLRIIDNKTAEYTAWDFSKLVNELEGLDAQLMNSFFPEIAPPSSEDLQDPVVFTETHETPPPSGSDVAEFICPQCFHQWEMSVTKEAIYSGRLGVK